MTAFTDVTLIAAGSGRPAMASFVRKQRGAGQIDHVRVDAIASDALAALHDVIRKHQVTYAEYDALKAWLIRVGEYGEWPLLLDLFIEHVVEEVVNADRRARSAPSRARSTSPGPGIRRRGHSADARG